MALDRVAFALGLVALGIIGLVAGDFALLWQPVPASLPGREYVAYVSAVILVATGAGLLVTRTRFLSAKILFVYLLIWLLLKVPALVAAPMVEVNWLGAGEIAVIFAAGWVLITRPSGYSGYPESPISAPSTVDPRVRLIRYLFAIALIPIGLSHFVYARETLAFVPTWLPFRSGLADLGGAGHIAAGLGVLLGVYPRLAATLEAAMIGAFTLLVWVPAVAGAPTNRLQWTGFVMSWVIGAAAWVVAGALPRRSSPERPTPNATRGETVEFSQTIE